MEKIVKDSCPFTEDEFDFADVKFYSDMDAIEEIQPKLIFELDKVNTSKV